MRASDLNCWKCDPTDYTGDPCPRCSQPTEIREHDEITDKLLAQPFYYSRWFNCINPRCKTTLIMPERFKMFPRSEEPYEGDIALAVMAEDDEVERQEDYRLYIESLPPLGAFRMQRDIIDGVVSEWEPY